MDRRRPAIGKIFFSWLSIFCEEGSSSMGHITYSVMRCGTLPPRKAIEDLARVRSTNEAIAFAGRAHSGR